MFHTIPHTRAIHTLRAAIHPMLPQWIAEIRSDTGARRIKAVADTYEVLRQWEVAGAALHEAESKLVRGAIMDDMIWLVRYGDPYLQVKGVRWEGRGGRDEGGRDEGSWGVPGSLGPGAEQR